nr:hotdog domain-containing protein [Fundidesulfovibrio terrae]
MTHCLFHHGIKALTADLHVRYTHAIPCDASLDIRAAITRSRRPLYHLRAELTQDGRRLAWAEAKFLARNEGAPLPGA